MLIYEVTELTVELTDAMHNLVPQLSSSNSPPSKETLQTIIKSETTKLLVARTERGIVGTLTLVLFHIPTGIRAWIEDVVVDKEMRGEGVGYRLNQAAIQHAQIAGAVTVDLTSRPSREEANRLYQRLGFEKRETNVYRYHLKNLDTEKPR